MQKKKKINEIFNHKANLVKNYINSNNQNSSMRSNASTGRYLKFTTDKNGTESNENNEIKILKSEKFFLSNLQIITKPKENENKNKNKNLYKSKSSIQKDSMLLKAMNIKKNLRSKNYSNLSKQRSSIVHILKEVKRIQEKENNKEINISPEQLDEIIKISIKKSKSGKYKLIIKTIDIVLAILVSGNIFFSLLENELFYKETNNYLKQYFSDKENKEITRDIYKQCEKREITKNENFFRKINLMIVIFILILNFIRYYLLLILNEIEGLISEKDGFWSTGLWKYLLLESIILGIFDPPNLNFFFTGIMKNYIFAFSLGGLICIETMFKCYVIIRIYSHYSKYLTESAKSLCNNTNVNNNIHFALKCELKNRPFTMLLIILFSSILLFGFSLRTFEYFLIEKGFKYGNYKGEGNDQDKLKDLINSIWLIIVTMTTVGYGDFFPNENYGRLICLMSYLIGCLSVSLTVVSLAIISEFNESELKAYSIIKKLNADNNAILKAADVISNLCLLRMKFMKNECRLSEKFVYFMKLKTSILALKDDFKVAKNTSLPIEQTIQIMHKDICENYDILKNITHQLIFIQQYAHKINQSQKKIFKVFKKIYFRQKVLGEYLVKMNNINFKKKIKFINNLKYKNNQ